MDTLQSSDLYWSMRVNWEPMETRPWGSYKVLGKGRFHKVKRLTVKPGKRISQQLHELRNEHWVVVEGKALVTLDDEENPLDVGIDRSLALAKYRLLLVWTWGFPGYSVRHNVIRLQSLGVFSLEVFVRPCRCLFLCDTLHGISSVYEL